MSRLRSLLALLRHVAGPSLVVGERLVACRRCGADAVWPVWWEPTSEREWRIALRCGACGFAREAVVDDEVALAFDRALDLHQHEIRTALAAAEREDMTRELHVLRIALDRDLVDASDFAR